MKGSKANPVIELEKLKQLLEDTSEVRLAVLFGSAAKHALRRRSDIDLGLSLMEGTLLAPGLSAALERVVGRPVDIVLLDEAPPLLRFEIARDGIVLVERLPYGWADFRARAMIDWWDWAPTARMMHQTWRSDLRDEARRGPS